MKSLSSPAPTASRQLARWAAIAALPFLFGLTSCTYVPDAVNPVEWYRGVSSAFEDEESQKSRAEAKAAGEQLPPLPNADKSYPNLSEVPDRPQVTPAEERNRAVQGLAADRENARYIDIQPGRTPPSGAPGLAPVAAPRTPVTSAPASPLPPPAVEPPAPAEPQPRMEPGRDPNAPFQHTQPPGPQSSVSPSSRSATLPPLPAAGAPGKASAQQQAAPVEEPESQEQERPEPPGRSDADPRRVVMPVARPQPAPRAALLQPMPELSAPPASRAPRPQSGHSQSVAPLGAGAQTITTAPRAAEPRPVPSANVRSANSLVEETFRNALAQSRPATTPATWPVSPEEQVIVPAGGASSPSGLPAVQPAVAAGAALPPARLGNGPTSRLAIYFAHGSAAISADDRQLLREAAALHKVHGGSVRIDGYASNRTASCDPTVKEISNFRISSRRAEAVARELARFGVPRSEMVIRALSDQGASFCAATLADEAADRRVEIFLDY